MTILTLSFWTRLFIPAMPLWIAGVILLVAVALFVVGVIFVRRASRSKRLDNHWSQGASRLGKWFG